MNPAVPDPQVIPQTVPPRRRGRPTLYSPELIEEFCGLIVDGRTMQRACKEAGMPSKRTIQYWLKEYPEFRREFEQSVQFRNQIWMDRCVDLADDTPDEANWTKVKARIDARWKQLNGARLKAVAKPGDKAKPNGEEKRDPIFEQLYAWELDVQRRRGKEFTYSKDTDRPSE
jgi:hypothetical protein